MIADAVNQIISELRSDVRKLGDLEGCGLASNFALPREAGISARKTRKGFQFE